MNENEALEAAIEVEFHYRVNHTYGMMRWGLSAFKAGWEAGKTGVGCPYKSMRHGVSEKQRLWVMGKQAYYKFNAARNSAPSTRSQEAQS